MAAEGDNNFMRYVYRGEEGEIIPREATHITIDKSCTFVRARAFEDHPNIVEVICHENVKKIGVWAFIWCDNLRRVIMPGVKIVGKEVFYGCEALEDVECGKLEKIKEGTFGNCKSLRSISLPSARIVEPCAFAGCEDLLDVKFGSKLERFEVVAFYKCESLERITIPLNDGIITAPNIFQGCEKLVHVDLVDGPAHETIAALHLIAWRNNMKEEIDSIDEILVDATGGECNFDRDEREEKGDPGEKAQVIRSWIRSVIDKLNHYKAEHRRLLNEAATLLEMAMWKANLDDNNGGRIVREGVRTTRGSVKRARKSCASRPAQAL